jgi:hypothetical protein
MGTLDPYPRATVALDFKAATLRALFAGRGSTSLTAHEPIRAVRNFVRDQIAFVDDRRHDLATSALVADR